MRPFTPQVRGGAAKSSGRSACCPLSDAPGLEFDGFEKAFPTGRISGQDNESRQLPQQLRQLGDVHCDPPRFVARSNLIYTGSIITSIKGRCSITMRTRP